MLRNILSAALRNLTRDRLYTAISMGGLAVAFAAALLIAQFVRNEFSYDRWVPGYQKVYKISQTIVTPGQAPLDSDLNPAATPVQLKEALPGAKAARLDGYVTPPLRRGPGSASIDERVFAWADPDIFKVLPLPVLAGDLSSALQQPDTVVITRRIARKYFGRDLPIGDTLQVQAAAPPPGSTPQAAGGALWHSLKVTAVLADLPSNTNLTAEIFASGLSAYSSLAWEDAQHDLTNISAFTFIRLSSAQTQADLQRALPIISKPEQDAWTKAVAGSTFAFHAVPLADVHLTPPGLTAATLKPVGSRTVGYAIAGVGALIVLVAAINFVTLTTARAGRRAVEVGVRKVGGATRENLIVQFVAEALVQVGLSAVVALALAEVLVKPFSAFVQRDLSMDFVHDPQLLAGVAAATIVIGLQAAIYPALVLSSFRPATVLKGGLVPPSGSPLARQALVVIQFAILIGLIATTITLYRQTRYALDRGLGAADSALIAQVTGPCGNAFASEVRKLAGVEGAACSSANAVNSLHAQNMRTVQAGGKKVFFDIAPVDVGFFELYGVRPAAGRLFSRDHGEDNVFVNTVNNFNRSIQPTVIVNETAAHILGFSDPRAAIGKQMIWSSFRPPVGPDPNAPPNWLTAPSTIIAVVPDMPSTVRAAIEPTFYFVMPPQALNVLSIKMSRQNIATTIKAVAATWKRINGDQPLIEDSLAQLRLTQYLDLIVQGATIGICAVLAILIACLGLLALSAYATERRTKEIGVRKAMGATTGEVVFLLLWQFTLPVIVASLIAIPTGFFAMDWWLRGFAYRVDLPAWTFVLAVGAALVIAWLTVAYQSFTAAHAEPARALRYE